MLTLYCIRYARGQLCLQTDRALERSCKYAMEYMAGKRSVERNKRKVFTLSVVEGCLNFRQKAPTGLFVVRWCRRAVPIAFYTL